MGSTKTVEFAAKVNPNDVVVMIAEALQFWINEGRSWAVVKSFSVDADHKSSEVIITLADGRDFVVSSSCITELESEGE